MDQMKIGKFIAELRKEQNMTQLDLAEKLDVTDRAISKWENGRGMPDISLIKPLCDALSISINELLSGERIRQENITEKAEENIISTLKHSERNLKNTKRRYSFVLASVLVGVLITLLAMRSVNLFVRNIYPNKEFFGDDYIQIVYPTSISDYIIAKEVLKEADKAFSTITTAEEAEADFGELASFCITAEDAIRENHRLQFVSANFKHNNGYIWIEYDSEAYNENGNITYGSWGILSRLELKKVDNKWTVISIKEPA